MVETYGLCHAPNANDLEDLPAPLTEGKRQPLAVIHAQLFRIEATETLKSAKAAEATSPQCNAKESENEKEGE